jgi:glycine cleavage system H protein
MFAKSLLRTNIRAFSYTKQFNFVKLSTRFQSTFKLNPESIVSKYSTQPTLKFTNEHEWIAVHPDGTGFIGITNYAADALGDATFIELPSHQIGEKIASGETVSSVESVKSASDIYSPVDCEIVEVNDELDARPELINSDPMGEGWIVKVKVDNLDGLNDLLDSEQYKTFVEESDH